MTQEEHGLQTGYTGSPKSGLLLIASSPRTAHFNNDGDYGVGICVF